MREAWDFVRKGSLDEALSSVSVDERGLAEWLACALDAHGVARNQVIRASQLNQTFAYQIMSGARHASRDKLIQLAFGLCLDLDETDDMLEHAGASPLRPYDRRDVVVAFCLERKVGLAACDELLWARWIPTIVDDGVSDRAIRRPSAHGHSARS
jgi:hypothetical protein